MIILPKDSLISGKKNKGEKQNILAQRFDNPKYGAAKVMVCEKKEHPGD